MEDIERKLKGIVEDPTLILFIITIFIRCFYGETNPLGILPDGSLYLDSARFLATDGYLSSNVYNELYYPSYYQTGRINHLGTVFLFGSWFCLNGVSYMSGKVLMYVVASVSVGLLYVLASVVFGDKKVALFSSILAAIHPTLIFYSIVLYGPEFMSALITMLFIITLVSSLEQETFGLYLIVGLLSFASILIWGTEFYSLFMVLLFGLLMTKGVKKGFLESLLHLVMPVLIISFSTDWISWILCILLYSVISMLLFLIFKDKFNHSVSGFGVTLIVLSQFMFIRSYAHPELILGPPYHPRTLPVPLEVPTSWFIFHMKDLLSYYNLLADSVGPPLLIGFIAFALYRRKELTLPLIYLGVQSILIILMRKQVYISSRFFITLTLLIIMCALSVIFCLSKEIRNQEIYLIKMVKRFRVRFSVNVIKLGFIFLVITIPSYYQIYERNYTMIETYNTFYSNWKPIIDWIEANTSDTDRLAVFSNARQWAWLTDRSVYRFALFNGTEEVRFSDVRSSYIIEFIQRYDIGYLVADNSLMSNSEMSYIFYSHLRLLPIIIGDGSRHLTSYALEKVSCSKDEKINLFRVLSRGQYLAVQIAELTEAIERYGNVSMSDGKIDIVVGPEVGVKSVTMRFPAKMETRDILVIMVRNSTLSVGGALLLRSSNGTEFFQSYVNPGIYFYDLERVLGGSSLSQLCLYASLRKGEGYFTITFDGIWILRCL